MTPSVALGERLRRAPRVDSTMRWARDAVASGEAGPGCVFLADEQTDGRGRRGRAWVSPAGRGLYVTAVLPGSLAAPSLTLVGALAVAETVADRCGIETRVKWPNDLVAGRLKWGGLLAEVIPSPTGEVVLLGLGLNVSHSVEDLGADLAESATSLALLTGMEVDRERLLTDVLERLSARLAPFQLGGFEAVAAQFARYSSFAPGDRLELEMGGSTRAATFRGLDGEGRLLLEGEPAPVASATLTRVRKAVRP
ncbi:MAG: biotin--[acetyl-CoA-carboxylase] ligase [Gemmatimonadota bacterium]